jgi:hypothetical protein
MTTKKKKKKKKSTSTQQKKTLGQLARWVAPSPRVDPVSFAPPAHAFQVDVASFKELRGETADDAQTN